METKTVYIILQSATKLNVSTERKAPTHQPIKVLSKVRHNVVRTKTLVYHAEVILHRLR